MFELTPAAPPPAEELRAAAARLRGTEHHGSIHGDTDNEELIRLVGNLLRGREPLAAWLEQTATIFAEDIYEWDRDCDNCGPGCTREHGRALVCDRCGNEYGKPADADADDDACTCFDHALATARAILGGGRG